MSRVSLLAESLHSYGCRLHAASGSISSGVPLPWNLGPQSGVPDGNSRSLGSLVPSGDPVSHRPVSSESTLCSLRPKEVDRDLPVTDGLDGSGIHYEDLGGVREPAPSGRSSDRPRGR